jgi:flagellar motor switch/type III secretory pathway protein FliN
MMPLALEALDPSWVALVNEAVGLGRGFSVPMPGGPFELCFTAAPPRYAADRVFEVSFGREPAWAGVTDFARLVERTGLLGPDGDGDRVPESLVPALVEAMLEEVIRAVQAKLGVQAGPVRSRPDPSGSDPECRLHFTLSASGRPVTAGHLGFGAGLTAPIREAIGSLPKAPATRPAAIPLFATVEIGWTTLPLSTLAGLAPDDLIFPDRMVAEPDNGPIVRLGPRLAFQACRDGAELVLIGRVADAGSPHGGPLPVASPASAGPVPPGTVDPPIELALVLGRVAIPLDRAAGLGPGTRLAFAIDPTSVLQLVGGGRTLGIARLIRLADRVGVRLLAWPGMARRGSDPLANAHVEQPVSTPTSPASAPAQ